MAFPSDQYLKIIEDTVEKIATINSPIHFRITEIVANIYKHGALSGLEQMRINFYGDNDYGVPLFTSEWVSLSDAVGANVYWIGNIRFDFISNHIKSGLDYFIGFETTNYTRDGDTSFISISIDYPLPTNIVIGNNPGVGLQIYGLK